MFARQLLRTPCWFFHSKDDVCIAASESIAIVDAIREAQRHEADATGQLLEEFPEVRCTLYEQSPAPGCDDCRWMDGHNCWDQAHATPLLWEWLLSQPATRMRMPALPPVAVPYER